MRILQWNSGNTLSENIHEHIQYIIEKNITAALIQEQGIHFKCPEPYICYKNKKTCIILHKHLKHTLVPTLSLESEDIYTTAVAIQPHPLSQPIVLVSLYRPHTSQIQHTLDFFQLIDDVTDEDSLIGGDFNIHIKELGNKKTTLNGDAFKKMVHSSRNIKILNNGEATRTGWPGSTVPQNPSAIDLTLYLSKVAHLPTTWETSDQYTSDHHQIIINLDIAHDTESTPTKQPQIFNFNMKKWNDKTKTEFLTRLSSNSATEPKHTSVHDKAIQLTKKIQDAANHAGLLNRLNTRIKRNKKIKQYGWSEHCEKILEEKRNLEHQMKLIKHCNETQYHEIKTKRNKLAKEIRKEILINKTRQWESICNQINSQTHPSRLWKIVQRLSKAKKKNSPAELLQNNKQFSKNPAQRIQECWAPIFEINDSETDLITQNSNREEEERSTEHKEITETEILNVLNNMKNSTPGMDGIPVCALQSGIEYIMKDLKNIFNESLTAGEFPECWKHALMIPIPKTPGTSNNTQFRPISLLPTMAKLFEGVMKQRLEYSIKTLDLLSPAQFGFRKGMSAPDQVLRIIQSTYDQWSNEQDCLLISLDISKAFDSVSHVILQKKLEQHNITDKCTRKWLKSFLEHRIATVKYGECFSDIMHLKRGVPQGGPLSPTLFNIFMNDIKELIPLNNLAIYADDIALLLPLHRKGIQKRNQDISFIQHHLDKIAEWATVNKLSLSATKTECQILSPRQNPDPDDTVEFSLGQHKLKPKRNDTIRYLGVLIDSKLKFKEHINSIVTRANSRINFLKSISGTDWGADTRSKLLLYKNWIRPLIEYSTPAVINMQKTLSQKLETIQNQAIRIILGTTKTCSMAAAQAFLNLPPIVARRQQYAAIKVAELKRAEHVLALQYKAWEQSHDWKKQTKHPEGPFQHMQWVYRTLKLQQQDIENETTRLRTSPPWEETPTLTYANRLISESWPKLGSAANRTAEQKKQSTKYLFKINKQITEKQVEGKSLNFYCDGSAFWDYKGGGGAAAVWFTDSGILTTKKENLGPIADNYIAELHAIELALEEATKSINQPKKQIIVLSDCQEAITQSLNATPKTDSQISLLSKIGRLKKVLWLKGKKLYLDWIPGHSGNTMNEAADLAARSAALEGRKLSESVGSTCKPLFLLKNIIKLRMNYYQIQWWKKFKGTKYPVINQPFSANKKLHHNLASLNPRTRNTIHRLILKNEVTNTILHKIDPLKYSPLCLCGEIDSTEHQFNDCAFTNTHSTALRQALQIEDPSTQIDTILAKSIASLENLQALAKFLETTKLHKKFIHTEK